MKNYLLQALRKIHNHKTSQVARALEISEGEYLEIEHGMSLISTQQAHLLALFYDTRPRFFLAAATQLDDYISLILVCKRLKEENTRLKIQLHPDKRDPS